MPNDLSHSLAPSFEGLPSTCLDDAGVVATVTEKLFAELAPRSNFARVIALDIIQVEIDILRMRQAKADVVDGALKAEFAHLLNYGTVSRGHHTHFIRRFHDKLILDVMRGRTGISRRVETVLRYYGETLSGLRSKTYRRHAEITQKMDLQLERLERRRRNLRRDFYLYQSSRAQIFEASSGDP